MRSIAYHFFETPKRRAAEKTFLLAVRHSSPARCRPIETMAAPISKNVQLAMALPVRLRTFLARYPPAAILPDSANPETVKTGYQEETPNPFMPTKHPITGRWHDPKYSLRRQAELVKMARKHHVEELLPFTTKGTEERLRKRVELGLRVKGTGVGQKVKGHKHERQLQVKYARLIYEVLLGILLANLVVRQDGEEETSHAGDARTYQGIQEGRFRTPSDAYFLPGGATNKKLQLPRWKFTKTFKFPK